MTFDALATALLALLLAYDLKARGLWRVFACVIGAALTIPVILCAGQAGFALLTLGAYTLGSRLSMIAAGDDRAHLPAALAAGALALSGPFGAVGGCVTILVHALLNRGRPRAEALTAGAVLLYVPLILLVGIMAAAFFQNRDIWAVEAGGGLFLRGALPRLDDPALRTLLPLALPLLFLAAEQARSTASGPVALACGGLCAALVFLADAPLASFLLAAALAAGTQSLAGSRWASAVSALAGIGFFAVLLPMAGPKRVPLAASWQLLPASNVAPPSWGAPRLDPGAPLPHFIREDGRYVNNAQQ